MWTDRSKAKNDGFIAGGSLGSTAAFLGHHAQHADQNLAASGSPVRIGHTSTSGLGNRLHKDLEEVNGGTRRARRVAIAPRLRTT